MFIMVSNLYSECLRFGDLGVIGSDSSNAKSASGQLGVIFETTNDVTRREVCWRTLRPGPSRMSVLTVICQTIWTGFGLHFWHGRQVRNNQHFNQEEFANSIDVLIAKPRRIWNKLYHSPACTLKASLGRVAMEIWFKKVGEVVTDV
jgi:hypothetical protein